MADSGKTMSKGTKYRDIAVKTTPLIILGGVVVGLGWRYLSRAWNRESESSAIPARSLSLASLHGGKLAMERLIEYKNARGKPTESEADIKDLETILSEERPRFKELQRILARLEMGRREHEAIELLENALKKARDEGKPHEAYEIEMLLAEMYMYKGDVQKASNCKCLKDEDVSDARKPLYQAIISLMDQNEKDALDHWQEFKDAQHLINMPDAQDEDHFSAFKNAVNVLKNDIDAATRPKQQYNAT